MLTIDASVWVNADSPSEANHAASRALMDWIADHQTAVVVPTLLRVEVTAAISRVRGDSSLAREFSDRIARLPFIRWISLDEVSAAQAAELAAAHSLRGADAVYAAVAIASGSMLVSLDREHLTRLAGIVPTRRPADALVQLSGIMP